jgi:hypothetical protein
VKSFQIWALSSSKIEALVCIRDATTHNGGDLAKNRDEESLGKVQSADIPNINLNGFLVTLHPSRHDEDFMEFVRQCYLAVCMYKDDG